MEEQNHHLAMLLIALMLAKFTSTNDSIAKYISYLFGGKRKQLTSVERYHYKKRLTRGEALNFEIARELDELEAFYIKHVLNLANEIGVPSKKLYSRWGADSSNFKERISKNIAKLKFDINKILVQQSLTEGKVDNVNQLVSARFGAAKQSMSRLIRTEGAFFTSQAIYALLESKDVKRYQLIATLDNRTSEICRSMDGKIFKMSDYEPGVTAPPFHPNCRTVMSEVI